MSIKHEGVRETIYFSRVCFLRYFQCIFAKETMKNYKKIEYNINQKFDLWLLNWVHKRFIVPLIRNNITVAIIDMTDNQKSLENNPKNILNETVCPLPQKLNTSLESSENLTINGAIRAGRKFAWTKEWRSLIDLFF